MRTSLLRLAIIASTLLGLGASRPSAQAGFHWYDGGTPRPLQVVPDLLAEFGPAGAVRAAMPDAQVVHRSGGVTVFRVSRPLPASARVSLVFREGPLGRLMALPGDVLVNFRAGWDHSRVLAWAAEHDLEIDHRLELRGNWYVLRTPPGPPSLEVANQLQESGEVVSASPNWWLQAGAR